MSNNNVILVHARASNDINNIANIVVAICKKFTVKIFFFSVVSPLLHYFS